MKKLYRKGTVHPSPHIKSDENLLPLLPVATFSLAALLSPDDRQVLAYLITTASGDRNPNSRLNKSKTHKKPHSPHFHCDCFSCYTSYWVRWDSSPNRQLIHEIIDAYEDSLEKTKMTSTNKKKKDRRKRPEKSSVLTSSSYCTNDSEVPSLLGESIPTSSSSELAYDGGSGLESTEESHSGGGGEEEEEEEKGTMRRFVNFISEKVFGLWG